MWYTRSEAQKRFSFFFSSTSLAGAFGGLLASGIAKMDGMCGYSGWRWVFIIEGVLTSVVAIILFFFIADFPEDVKWLNEEERTYMRAKLAKDVGKAAHNVHLGKREVLGVFKDCKYSAITPLFAIDCSALTSLRQGLYRRFYVLRLDCPGLWYVYHFSLPALPSRRSLSCRICILRTIDYPDLRLQCDQNPAVLHSSLGCSIRLLNGNRLLF